MAACSRLTPQRARNDGCDNNVSLQDYPLGDAVVVKRCTMLIKACLNGSRLPGAHPALPLTPQELASAAEAAFAAGAGAVHVHPRDRSGFQSLASDACGAAITAIRMTVPGLPVGVTTILADEIMSERRLAMVRTWTVLPDFASVNFSEPGAEELCELLLSMGIGVEAGLATADDAQRLVASGLGPHCLRVLIEPTEETTVEGALTITVVIEAVLDAVPVQVPRLLHGYEATAWALVDAAARRGYDTRIGLEDVLTLPDGPLAHDNAELVAVARTRVIAQGRLPQTGQAG